ncbi:chorismate synthase, partial [Staphylococcus hominis]
QLDINFYSRVVEIGGVKDDLEYDLDTIKSNIDKNDVRVVNDEIAQTMRDKIDAAKKAGDTIGGVVQTIIEGVPVGIGSYVHY